MQSSTRVEGISLMTAQCFGLFIRDNSLGLRFMGCFICNGEFRPLHSNLKYRLISFFIASNKTLGNLLCFRKKKEKTETLGSTGSSEVDVVMEILQGVCPFSTVSAKTFTR